MWVSIQHPNAFNELRQCVDHIIVELLERLYQQHHTDFDENPLYIVTSMGQAILTHQPSYDSGIASSTVGISTNQQQITISYSPIRGESYAVVYERETDVLGALQLAILRLEMEQRDI